jgi:hypothetical protein
MLRGLKRVVSQGAIRQAYRTCQLLALIAAAAVIDLLAAGSTSLHSVSITCRRSGMSILMAMDAHSLWML